MRRGQAVTLAPHAIRLTTQQVVDFLAVSLPTLIKLLEYDKIPYETPNRHRRVRLVGCAHLPGDPATRATGDVPRAEP